VKFTCLLPVHSGDDARAFAGALSSIAANSVRPDRLLICQDGPVPASLADLIAQSGASVARNLGPKGLHGNLNHALREVATPWVCRADADDFNRPDRFERQLAQLAADPGLAVSGGAIEEVSPDGRRRVKSMPLRHAEITRHARWRNPINHMTAFMRLDALQECGGYPAIPFKEDYGLWLTMIARGWRLGNLADVLVEARVGADFHRRRGGLHNLASEWALFRLRGARPQAALAHLGRAALLSSRAVTRVAYRAALNR
jgi:hypothetical protein